MTYSGKYWFEELRDWLKEEGFTQSSTCPALFYKSNSESNVIKLLDYVDDMLYFSTSDRLIDEFKSRLAKRFDVEFLGRVHWYLSCRIRQDIDYSITIDQSRYAKAIVKQFLESAGTAEDSRTYDSPLPTDFVATADDKAKTLEDSQALQKQYRIDYGSCVGCYIYLSNTRPDLMYAVAKLSKFSRQPGKKHMKYLLHLLRYTRDHTNYGIKFYADWSVSPLANLLREANVVSERPLLTFSDSSWQDCVDTGRSTGAYYIFYQGGIVDMSSNVPDPVAMSSAEAEYNEAAVATMSTAHLHMMLDELELRAGTDKLHEHPIKILLDNQSAVAMGQSFKDTKHTRHIWRHFHYVRQGEHSGMHKLHWIPNHFQLADIGTKPLGPGDLLPLLKYMVVTILDDNVDSQQPSVQEG